MSTSPIGAHRRPLVGRVLSSSEARALEARAPALESVTRIDLLDHPAPAARLDDRPRRLERPPGRLRQHVRS